MHKKTLEIHKNLEDSHYWFIARRKLMFSLLEKYLKSTHDNWILEIGCGTGGNLRALSNKYSVVGIDTWEDAVNIARKQSPGIEIVHGRAPQALGTRIKEFQAVLLMDVLEHIENDKEMLHELFQTVSRGTLFLVTVPADMSLWSYHDLSFGHIRRYNKREFLSLFSDDFLIIEEGYFNSLLYPLIRVIRGINNLRKHNKGYTDFRLYPPLINKCLEYLFLSERYIIPLGGLPFGCSLFCLCKVAN